MIKKLSKVLFVLCAVLPCAVLISGCFNTASPPSSPQSPVEYSIVYVVDGQTYHTTTTAGNEILYLPTSPTKTGWAFDGWFLDQSFETAFNIGVYKDTALTEDITVYAKFKDPYIETFTVYLDPGAGATISRRIQEVTEHTEYALPVPQKAGYKFLGWQLNGSLITNAQGEGLQTYEFGESINVVAKWQYNTSKYTISYGGAKKEVTANQSYVLGTSSLPKHIFVGWEYNGELLTNEQGESLGVYTFDHDITVTQRWERDPAYIHTLTLDANGGTVSQTKIEVFEGEDFTLPVPQKETWVFKYWYYKKSSSNIEITNKNGESLSACSFTKDLTVYAYFEQYTVWTYVTPDNSGDATCQGEDAFVPGQEVTLVAEPRFGYEFDGWYASSYNSWNKGQKLTENTEYTFTMPEYSVRFIAQFKKLYFPLTISADPTYPGAGTVNETNTQREYGTRITLNATTNPGYVFDGWYLNGELYDVNERVTDAYVSKNPSNFVAKWKAFTFTFNISGLNGDVLDTSTNKTASYYNLNNNYPPTAIGASRTFRAQLNKGQTFLGWFKGEELISKNLEYSPTMEGESVEFIVKSINCPVTLTSNIKEACTFVGLNDVTIIGETLEIIAKQNVGYIFEGWYKNGTLYQQQNELEFELTESQLALEARWRVCTAHELVNCRCACGFEKHSELTYCFHEDVNSLYFGYYPQSQVTDEHLINSLNTEIGAVNTESLKSWQSQVYNYSYDYNGGNYNNTYVYYKDFTYMFGQKPQTTTIVGYNGDEITFEYNLYNPFMLAQNYQELSENQEMPITSKHYLDGFSEIGELFATFTNLVTTSTSVISGDALTAYNNLFTKANEVYHGGKAALAYNGSPFGGSTYGAIINLNTKQAMLPENSSISEQGINYYKLVANLFGYNTSEAFDEAVEDLVNMYTQNYGKLEYQMLQSNCYYTENELFVFPVGSRASIYCAFMSVVLDNDGNVNVILNSVRDALKIINYNEDYNISTSTKRQILGKDVLFENGYYEYRAVYFKDYKPFAYENSNTATYSRQDDNGYNANTVYWFKYEPIKWNVLVKADNKLMVWSDIVLDSQPYARTYYYNSSNKQYFDASASNVENNKMVHSSAWHVSRMQGFLNSTDGGFYGTAFAGGDSKLEKLISVYLTEDEDQQSTYFYLNTRDKTYSNGSDYNPKSVTIQAKYGNDNLEAINQKIWTGDVQQYERVFLPTQSTVNNFTQSQRVKGYSDYALAQGLYVNPTTHNPRYYLMETGANVVEKTYSRTSYYVDHDGTIKAFGSSGALAGPVNLDVGVAPMLVFNLAEATK